MRLTLAIVIVFLLACESAAHAQEIVTLTTRPSVTQSYLLVRASDSQAIAILFPGSGGFIRLRSEAGQIRFGQNNFLVRSRAEFVNRGLIVAIVDAPSDQQGGYGMSDEFRLGEQHFADISAVITDLNNRFSGAPLFLVGTSRGSTSAAALASRFDQRLAGVVLTATMFRQTGRRSTSPGPGLSKFDFATIRVPIVFVHHASDRCAVTPYGDAARLSDKYPLITVFGGLPPQSDECEPLSAHGFLGKESETVAEIVNWMLKKPFRHEVK